MRTIRRALAHRNTKGLTLTELLVTIAVIAIIAALAFPILNNIIITAKANASAAQAQIVTEFTDEWTSAGYRVTDGTGEDEGYLVAYDDINNNNLQDSNEPTLARVEKPDNNLTLVYDTDGTGTLTPTVDGAVGDVTYSVDGTLPAGVTLDPDTGVLSGVSLANETGSLAMPVRPRTLTALPDGGILISGRADSSFTLTGLPTTTVLDTGQGQAYIAKLNADNTWAWVTAVPAGYSSIRDIASLGGYGYIVTGSIEGPSTVAGMSLSSTANGAFVARLNIADGTLSAGTYLPETDLADMVVTADGAFITGFLTGTDVLGNFTYTGSIALGSHTITTAAYRTAFVAKMSTDGTWSWTWQHVGNGLTEARKIAVQDGTVYTDVLVESTATLGDDVVGAGQHMLRLNATTGAVTGVTSFIGAWPQVWDLVALADGGILVSGRSLDGNLTLGSTTIPDYGQFLAKMTSTGAWAWASLLPQYTDIEHMAALPGGGARLSLLLNPDVDSYAAGTAVVSSAGTWSQTTVIGETNSDLSVDEIAATPTGFVVAGTAYGPMTVSGRYISSTFTETGWIVRLDSSGTAMPPLAAAAITIRATDSAGATTTRRVLVNY